MENFRGPPRTSKDYRPTNRSYRNRFPRHERAEGPRHQRSDAPHSTVEGQRHPPKNVATVEASSISSQDISSESVEGSQHHRGKYQKENREHINGRDEYGVTSGKHGDNKLFMTPSQRTHGQYKQLTVGKVIKNGSNIKNNSHHVTSRHNSVSENHQLNQELSLNVDLPPSNEGSSIGCIVDGRYVRKNSMHSTQIATSASVHASNLEFYNNDRKESVPQAYSGARQKYDYRQYSYRSGDNTRNTDCFPIRNAYHNHNFHGRHPKYPKSFNHKQKIYRINNAIPTDEVYLQDELVYENWDNEEAVEPENSKFQKLNVNRKVFNKDDVEETSTQRDRLISQFEKGEYECMVCCELIRVRDYIWSCCNCYHIFHLRCIKKWARSPTALVKDGGWRCPTCQKITPEVPYNYFCFCGKNKDPEVNLHYTPHSCGEMCGKQRDDEKCIHRCNLLCHPGPCPPCSATVNKFCECGKTKKSVPCGQSEPLTCSFVCGKSLNCGSHKCRELCHAGTCNPCEVTFKQECFCKRSQREVLCEISTVGQFQYSCGLTCGKKLECGNHFCSVPCHSGPCATCNLLPEAIIACPCGKTPLQELYSSGKASIRSSCADSIPVCGKKCEKELLCGPKGNHHKCSMSCHPDDCPPCPLMTNIKCRCGSTSKEVTCKELTFPYVFHCEKRCNRRKDCGRHKCLNHCCINLVHKCELTCNKKLSCGSHHCQETCHGGNCPLCWNVSFDELSCHCGHNVLYPPIHCGTKPPECTEPCIRQHNCDHKVQHSCHSEETCPPCTALVTKWCFGHHEERSNVQCFLDGISCGKPCDKPLPCGSHRCREVCHNGSCLKPGTACTQPCIVLRTCGHPCSAPCHKGSCPNVPCKAKVSVSCPCGFRSELSPCYEDSNAYNLISVSVLATKINDLKSGDSVQLNDIFGKKNKYRLLCNEDCAIHERNKRLAVALQIQNPDLSCKPGPPCYSEFLKDETRKNMKFIANVYDKFCELVQLAKQSKQKCRSYAFPPMNRDQRRVIHELAEFFGCETQSYDEEPVKNVVITAFRERSWLPFVSIITVVEREMGLRRGPVPVINSASKVPAQVTVAEKKTKAIDYFDYEG